MYMNSTLEGFVAPPPLVKKPSGSARPGVTAGAVAVDPGPASAALRTAAGTVISTADIRRPLTALIPAFNDTTTGGGLDYGNAGTTGGASAQGGGFDLNSVLGTVSSVLRNVISPTATAAGAGTINLPNTQYRLPPNIVTPTTQQSAPPPAASVGGIPPAVLYGGLALLAVILLTQRK